MALVEVTETEQATVLSLNNPDHQNVLDDAMMDALHTSLDAIDRRRVLILEGKGDRFSMGRPQHTGGHSSGPEKARAALQKVVQLNARIYQWIGPTVAVLHGEALGAALGTATHCDMVFAEEGTRLAFPEMTYHLPPALVVSYLGRFLPPKAARYLIMTGESVDARDGLAMGLVSRVFDQGTRQDVVAHLAQHLGERSPQEQYIKQQFEAFYPWGDPKGDLTRGMEAVMEWSTRSKG